MPSGGRGENLWEISCEKSQFYAKKSYFFPILGGGGGHTPGVPAPDANYYAMLSAISITLHAPKDFSCSIHPQKK